MKERLPRAIVTGVLKIGDAEVECAVLDDSENTRVLTQAGFQAAIGRTRSPKSAGNGSVAALPPFLRASNLVPFISEPLLESCVPILFETEPGKGGKALGHRATLLPSVCWVYHDAKKAGKLLPTQQHVADRCDLLLRALTNVAIDALVDEVTGFQDMRMRDALQKILDKYVSDEARPWAKTFDDDFYKEIFRLNGWVYDPRSVKKPSIIGHWTNDIYDRLAPGVRDELHRIVKRDSKGRPADRLHQHLTEDGHPKLVEHLAGVKALMRASSNWRNFRSLLQRSYPKFEANFELPLEDDRGQPL